MLRTRDCSSIPRGRFTKIGTDPITVLTRFGFSNCLGRQK